jgi:type III restriction enzyme
MLAEGWDASTVTHILGVRAFGTQLLCEQVVGRALRRFSYEPDANGMFPAEYAEVYGVPFSFLPTAGTTVRPKIPVIPNRVRTLPQRAELEIRYPRVIGYRYEIPAEKLQAQFTSEAHMALSTQHIPTEVHVDPIVGRSDIHTLEHLRAIRLQAVAFGLARRVLDNHFRDDENRPKVWLFPQLVSICKRWLAECLTCSSEAFPQLLLLAELSARAASRIHQAIVESAGVSASIKPVLAENDPMGSTAGVEFDTVKPVIATTKSHLNALVIDSGWEEKVGQVLESMPEVRAYVKNDRIGPDRKGLRIPYSSEGKQVDYIPDFIARIDDGQREPVTLLIEVTGERREAKLAKAGTAIRLWVPAVNNWGRLGRWDYIEVHDPWMAQDEIRGRLRSGATINA